MAVSCQTRPASFMAPYRNHRGHRRLVRPGRFLEVAAVVSIRSQTISVATQASMCSGGGLVDGPPVGEPAPGPGFRPGALEVICVRTVRRLLEWSVVHYGAGKTNALAVERNLSSMAWPVHSGLSEQIGIKLGVLGQEVRQCPHLRCVFPLYELAEYQISMSTIEVRSEGTPTDAACFSGG